MTSYWARCRLKSPASRLFAQPFVRRRSKKTLKLRVNGLCEGNPSVTDGFPSQRAVTRKMFPFDDVIMITQTIFIHNAKTMANIFGRNAFLGHQIRTDLGTCRDIIAIVVSCAKFGIDRFIRMWMGRNLHCGWKIISEVGSGPGVGVTKSISSVKLISRFFHHYRNTWYLLNIMFIFDRCRHSSAAATPVKYECDANNLTGTFARSKILLTEKLTNGALVTPTPVWVEYIQGAPFTNMD